MDFALPPALSELQDRVRTFIEAEVFPLEARMTDEGIPADLLDEARRKAREAEVFLPHLPKEWGGLGLSLLGLCPVFEEAGRSLIGPLVLNCSAPDEGNMHLLLRCGTEEQKARYLRPLAEGKTRSAFAMTEPAPGAGSDPAMMQTRARRGGGGFVLDGHKWFASGAHGAAFTIVATVTDAAAPPKDAMTLFIVERDTPGFRVVREIPVMGSSGPGGHCEIRLESCRVGESQVLGGVGAGFALMQARLGPARLTHCMRWLGAAARSLAIAARRARDRNAFSQPLAEHEAVQWMLADSAIEIHAARLMVLHAAWAIEAGDEARLETSMCKVFVAEAIGRVIDRAVQVCGCLGYSADLPLERFYRDARAFRIYDGPSEVHRRVVAREVLRRT
jgi:acyl-CoA dehydrogenase